MIIYIHHNVMFLCLLVALFFSVFCCTRSIASTSVRRPVAPCDRDQMTRHHTSQHTQQHTHTCPLRAGERSAGGWDGG